MRGHLKKGHRFNGLSMLAFGGNNSWNLGLLMSKSLPQDEPMCEAPRTQLPIANQRMIDQLIASGCPSADQFDALITCAETFQSGTRNVMVGVFGPPSSGKTTTAMKLGELMGWETRLVNVLNIKDDRDIGPSKDPSLHRWLAQDTGRSKMLLVDEFEKSNRRAIARIFQVIK